MSAAPVGRGLHRLGSSTDSLPRACGARFVDSQRRQWAVRRITPRRSIVLYTIAVVLLVLWLLGLVTSFTAGGLLHILLVAAVIVVIYQLVTGSRGV